MVHELVRLVEEAERLLNRSPPKNYIQLDKMGHSDEELLTEFLRQERDGKPHYQRYKDWYILIGEPLMYDNPKKYARKKKRDASKKAKFGDNESLSKRLLRLRQSQVTIDDFIALRSVYTRFLDLEIKLLEYQVAYAKELATREETSPINIARNQGMRDEIYRKIFPKGRQFQSFYFGAIKFSIISMEAMYSVYYAATRERERAERVPILGWFIRRFTRKIPPRATFQNFARDETDYCRIITNRIYGNKPHN